MQFITEKFVRPSGVDFDLDFDYEAANPQIFEESYLMRYELENLSTQAQLFLFGEKKRSYEQVIRAAQIIREELWGGWEGMLEIEKMEGDKTNYNIGSNSKLNDSGSYRTWVIYSDPDQILECTPEDWFNQDKWKCCDNWTWYEVYAVMALWCIDESVVYLNSERVFQATTWLLRAQEYMRWTRSYEPSLARKGGIAKSKKYDPLKKLVSDLVAKRKWPSRRNAAMTIAHEVIAASRQMNVPLSEMQAEVTIYGWLKEMGLPANI